MAVFRWPQYCFTVAALWWHTEQMSYGTRQPMDVAIFSPDSSNRSIRSAMSGARRVSIQLTSSTRSMRGFQCA